MTSLDLIPFGAAAQRAVERQWLAAVRDHALPGGVRTALRSSWERSLGAAGTDLPVLLLGEPGTGAELFARAIHQAGSRRDRPFLTANCAALSLRQIEAAREGTLFLAELGDMPPAAQAWNASGSGPSVWSTGNSARDLSRAA